MIAFVACFDVEGIYGIFNFLFGSCKQLPGPVLRTGQCSQTMTNIFQRFADASSRNEMILGCRIATEDGQHHVEPVALSKVIFV